MITTIYILCTPTEFEKCRAIDPARADRDWIEVTREEAARITNNREWQAIDNPDFGKVIGQRETPTGTSFKVGEPEAVIVEDIIDTRKRIIIPREPDPPTAEEVESARCAAVRSGIRAAYPLETEIALINSALDAAFAGEGPPPAWRDYRASVLAIKEDTT